MNKVNTDIQCHIIEEPATMRPFAVFSFDITERESFMCRIPIPERRYAYRESMYETVSEVVHGLLEAMVKGGHKVSPEIRMDALRALTWKMLPKLTFSVPPRGKAMNIDAEREKAIAELDDYLGMSLETFFELYGVKDEK